MSSPVQTSADLAGKIGGSLLVDLTNDSPGATLPSELVIGECSSEGWDTDIWTRLIPVAQKPANDAIPPALKGLWADITIYRLHLRHEEYLQTAPGTAKHWARQRYEDALALFDKVAAGKAWIEGLLPATAAIVENQGTGGWFSDGQVFTPENFRGF